MNSEKWENILIHWVNCLKLTNPIKRIDTLRNGDFICNLLEILFPSGKKLHENLIMNVYDLIHLHYPNFDLNKNEANSLQTISTENFTSICSLLMHYSCMVGGKEMLMKPLCKISSNMQLIIRNFLEKTDTDVTVKQLISIIDASIKCREFSAEQSYRWIQGDTLLVGQSPLQDFFETYKSITGEDARADNIEELCSKLQLEGFERADLHQENLGQEEKIKKLGNQMKEKCNEVSKLRNELYTLVDKKPPDSRKFTVHDLEGHLRLEIENLEHYVEQLGSEQDDLRANKDNLLQKFKKSEEEVKICQEKTLLWESNGDELTGMYLKENAELGVLRAECTELSALLDELRHTHEVSTNDSFLDNTYDSVEEEANENLAHSIIEAQLKDPQKETYELQELLKESVQKGQNLQEQLLMVRCKYEDVNNELEKFQNDNELLLKVDELAESQSDLKALKEQLNANVFEFIDDNDEKDLIILTLKSKLKNTSTLHDECELMNINLKIDLERKQNDLVSVQSSLDENNKKYETLQTEANIIQSIYKDFVSAYNGTVFELNSLKKKYNQLDANILTCLERLETCICNQKRCEYVDKFSAFNDLIFQLQINKDHETNEKTNLRNALVKCEEQIASLQKEMLELNIQEKLSLFERQSIQQHLKCSESYLNNLYELIKSKNTEITGLSNTILQLNESIDELTKLKDVIADRDLEVSELKETDSRKEQIISEVVTKEAKMNGVIRSMEAKIGNYDEEIKMYRCNNAMLAKEFNRATEEIHEMKKAEKLLRKMNKRKEKGHLEKIHLLNLQVQEYVEKISLLETELSMSRNEYEMKIVELRDVQISRERFEAEFAATKTELVKKDELLMETMKKLEIEYVVIVKEKENLQMSVNDITTKYEKILHDKDCMVEDMEVRKNHLKSCKEKIRQIERECTQKDTIICENNKVLLNMKLELEAKKEEYKNLQEHIDELNLEANSYTFCIETLKSQNTEYDEKVIELHNELNVLNTLKSSIEARNSELEKNMEMVISDISLKSEALNRAIENLTVNKKLSEDNIESLTVLLQEANKNLEMLSNEHISIVDKHDKEITKLKDDIINLNKAILAHNKKESSYIHELYIIKDEMNYTFSKYTENLQMQQEIMCENKNQITNLADNIHEVIEKRNYLDKRYQEAALKLEVNQRELGAIINEKIAMEVKISDQKKKYEQEIELTNEQYAADIKNLNSKQVKYASALAKAMHDLKLQRGIRHRLENNVKRIQTKIAVVEREKVDLLEKIEKLERTKVKLETDYKLLRCSNEKYVDKSENELRVLEDTLIKQNNELQVQRTELKKNICILQNAVKSLKNENATSQRTFEETSKKNEKYNKELLDKITRFERSICNINTEQSSLRNQINFEKDKYEKMKRENKKTETKTVTEYENTMSKLKCAFDILQTGKEKLEIQRRNVIETCDKMTREQTFNVIQLNKKLELNDEEMMSLQQKIEVVAKQLMEHDKEVSSVSSELKKVKLIREAIGNEMYSIENELKKSEESHSIYLMKIDEENLSKITEMSNNFEVLKMVYEEICLDHANLKEEEAGLQDELMRMKHEKVSLQEIVNNNNISMEDFKNEISGKDSTISHLEGVIRDLKEKFQWHLSDLILLKKEKNKLDRHLKRTFTRLEKVRKNRDDVLESQTNAMNETEINIQRARADAIEVKSSLLKLMEEAENETNERDLRKKVKELIKNEVEAKEFFETKYLMLLNEQTKYKQLYSTLCRYIVKMNESIQGKPLEKCLSFEDAEESDLNVIAGEIEERIVDIYNKNRTLSELITALEADKVLAENKLKYLEKEKAELSFEKDKLLTDFKAISQERNALMGEQLELIKTSESHVDTAQEIFAIKMKNGDLENAISELTHKSAKALNYYKTFVEESKNYKNAIDKLLNDRNSLEVTVKELRQRLRNVQINYFHIDEENPHKELFQQKKSIEIVTHDVHKQFNRHSKLTHNLSANFVQIYERVVQGILSDEQINGIALMKDLRVEEVCEKLEELRDRALGAMEEIQLFEDSVEEIGNKPIKILQENVMNISSGILNVDSKGHEGEWKKKYDTLKQKLLLTENVKNSYEKKVKQLREENKKLCVAPKEVEHNTYKILLQQHIQTKDDQDKILNAANVKYEQLLRDFEAYKKQKEHCENTRSARESKLYNELQTMRDAYGKLITDNSTLGDDKVTLRKLLDDRSTQLCELLSIKEAYGKLLKDNKKLMSDVNTLKLKRSHDKEQFVKMLKKEKEGRSRHAWKKIEEVRNIYERKLENMKEKMIKAYEEEVDKKIDDAFAQSSENAEMLVTLKRYETELWEAKETIKKLKCSKLECSTVMGPVQSGGDSGDHIQDNKSGEKDVTGNLNTVSPMEGQDLIQKNLEDCRCSTMTRNVAVDVVEEVRFHCRTSINSVPHTDQNLELENEDLYQKYSAGSQDCYYVPRRHVNMIKSEKNVDLTPNKKFYPRTLITTKTRLPPRDNEINSHARKNSRVGGGKILLTFSKSLSDDFDSKYENCSCSCHRRVIYAIGRKKTFINNLWYFAKHLFFILSMILATACINTMEKT